VKKLRDIDLRINGTIEITRDVPEMMEKIKPAILDFWQTFRDENTPGRVDDSLTWIGEPRNGERLLNWYEKQYDEHFRKEQKQHQHLNAATTPATKESDIRSPVETPVPVVSEIWDGKKYVEHEEVNSAHAFAMKETIHHDGAIKEETILSVEERHRYGYVILAVAGVTMLVAFVLGIVVFRKRFWMRSHGFTAVDAMTPEERHVAGMQVNGYENPTYTYFDAGKVA